MSLRIELQQRYLNLAIKTLICVENGSNSLLDLNSIRDVEHRMVCSVLPVVNVLDLSDRATIDSFVGSLKRKCSFEPSGFSQTNLLF